MSIITDVLTAGTNNHQTTSEAGNFFATDFVTDGVVGAITNTSGVAPATGAWAVNQNTGSDMNVAISAGTGYVTATPTGQNSQRLRARNTATITQAIASNSTGSTRYDWIYYSVSATNANTPNLAGDNVTSVTVSRSTSNTVDNGTPPTYGKNIAIVTVTNGATAIVNGNIADKRVVSGASTTSAGIPIGAILAQNLSPGTLQGAGPASQSPVASTSFTDISGTSVTFTPTVASYMYIMYGGDIQINTNDITYLALNIDGTVVESAAAQNSTTVLFHFPAMRVYKATLTAASHTIKLQARTIGTPGNTAAGSCFWYGLLVSQV